jgi:hypothetical protein
MPIGLLKFSSVWFSDHFARMVNLNLQNWFSRFKNQFKLLNFVMVENVESNS